MKILSSIIFSILFIILFVNVNGSDDDFEYDGIDSYWMKYLDPKLKLNQINIPGTHDSGTLKMKNYFVEAWGQTQSLSIRDQLQHGNRYLDIRLAIEKDDKFNDIFISHGEFYCYDPDFSQESKLYLTDVLYACIGFLEIHPSETVIVHLKRENVPESVTSSYTKNESTSLAAILAKNTILDPKLNKYFYYNKNILNNFFLSF